MFQKLLSCLYPWESTRIQGLGFRVQGQRLMLPKPSSTLFLHTSRVQPATLAQASFLGLLFIRMHNNQLTLVAIALIKYISYIQFLAPLYFCIHIFLILLKAIVEVGVENLALSLSLSHSFYSAQVGAMWELLYSFSC